MEEITKKEVVLLILKALRHLTTPSFSDGKGSIDLYNEFGVTIRKLERE